MPWLRARLFSLLAVSQQPLESGPLQCHSIRLILTHTECWHKLQQTVMLLQVLNGNFLPTDDLYFKGMTLARCFRVLDSVVLAILIYLGALAFKRVVASEKNQLAYCIQVGHMVTSFTQRASLT